MADVARATGREVAVPLVVGTVATPLPVKKVQQPGEPTHEWSCYVRSAVGEDLGHIITKVTFQLHESFQQPLKERPNQPWEVTEQGWGEFEIAIVITFTDDAACPPLELIHPVRLFPTSEGVAVKQKHVVYEQYEEAVIWEPPQAFVDRLATHVPTPAHASTRRFEPLYMKFDEEAELRKLTAARQRVAQITASMQHQLDALPTNRSQ